MDFTPEQQAFIDASFNKRFAEIKAKAEADTAAKINETVAAVEAKYKTQTTALETELADLKKTAGGKGKEVDDSAVNERIAAIEADLKQARESAIKGRMESIAARLNAVNPEQAAILVRMQTKTDEKGNLVVVNSAGVPRLNAENKPMTEEELFKEFLDANPHFVKAGGQPGAGSQGAKGPGAGDEKTIKRIDFEKLSPAEQMKTAKTPGIQFTD